MRDGSALGDLTFLEDRGASKRSRIHRYRFDPAQETRIREGKSVIALAPGEDGWAQSTVDVDRARPARGDHRSQAQSLRTRIPVALIPGKPYGGEPMRSALRPPRRRRDRPRDRGGRRAVPRGPGPPAAPRRRAIRGVEPGAPLAEVGREAARRGTPARPCGLDATVLPVQGPPGTGKTHTGARMILDLVQTGKRVGVTAQSHRVIANLLEAVAKASTAEGVPLRIAQRADDDDVASDDQRIERVGTTVGAIAGLRAGTWDVVGGTSWLWAHEDAADTVDVLFVDEAGQLSLATVCSVSGAAGSVVLLGDPNQLPQVSQGVHPEGAGASALEHLVGEARTIAEDRGLLLGTTYRLHPDVNAYISDAFYEGRLETAPGERAPARGRRRAGGWDGGPVRARCRISGAGNRSREEAAWVAAAIEALVGRRWIDRKGRERRLEVAGRPRGRAVQRAGRGDRPHRRAPPRRAPQRRARSTSSRGARRPWRSIR